MKAYGLGLVLLMGFCFSNLASSGATPADYRDALNARCMTAIVQSAYRNQMVDTDGMVLASHRQNCENLRNGLKRMIAGENKFKVPRS